MRVRKLIAVCHSLEAGLNIAHKGMQMLHQALRHLPQPGILCARQPLQARHR
jgi:hypothetical protein